MNFGLIGYGKMGKMVEEAALGRGHDIVTILDPVSKKDEKYEPEKADVLIEFTRPDTAPDNIRSAAAAGKKIVSGSTGWYERLDEVTRAVRSAGASLLYSSNFSLGVNLFYRIAARAARLIDPFPEYDVAGFEVHHRKKADSPSGTAKTLAALLLSSMTRKKKVCYKEVQEKLGGEVIHFASLRAGAVPGVHSLLFDSAADTIELRHTARSREGFALGAVIAAEWLAAKKENGVYTMDDVLEGLLP
ncbi:MAG: 4-hydroxy-tetrahydrodipicolinate reductase [Treponema sp.]|jgi:4-hydroxy-tetrahydrodipicolinate reductase|nr:4-hydroxy-tetrahydrodipicolinate reductase [Treponema sp.]